MSLSKSSQCANRRETLPDVQVALYFKTTIDRPTNGNERTDGRTTDRRIVGFPFPHTDRVVASNYRVHAAPRSLPPRVCGEGEQARDPNPSRQLCHGKYGKLILRGWLFVPHVCVKIYFIESQVQELVRVSARAHNMSCFLLAKEMQVKVMLNYSTLNRF